MSLYTTILSILDRISALEHRPSVILGVVMSDINEECTGEVGIYQVANTNSFRSKIKQENIYFRDVDLYGYSRDCTMNYTLNLSNVSLNNVTIPNASSGISLSEGDVISAKDLTLSGGSGSGIATCTLDKTSQNNFTWTDGYKTGDRVALVKLQGGVNWLCLGRVGVYAKKS
jgi:hypothetical protein